MKQNEIDAIDLSVNEYYDKFCKGLSFEVLKRAYGYSQKGHSPSCAIATAAALYAEPFKQRELMQHGLTVEREKTEISIWKLETETASAQRALLEGEWDFHNRAMCIARLGENYNCTRVVALDFPSVPIIGVYVHRHRFAAIVGVEAEHDDPDGVAEIVAKNAVAHYPEYLDRQERRKWHLKHDKNPQKYPPLPDFKTFLLEQPLLFVEGVNPRSIFAQTRHIVSVGEFVKRCSQEQKQMLCVTSVNVYGEF